MNKIFSENMGKLAPVKILSQPCLPPAPLLVHLGAGRHPVNGHEENLTGLDHPEEDLPHTRNAECQQQQFRKRRTVYMLQTSVPDP
jgi:hypothetical protein